MARSERMDEEQKLRMSTTTQRVFCDFHIHSLYSRATSEKMRIETIAHYAQIKGLNLVGTGDFTHPAWIKELKSSLKQIPDTNLYHLNTSGTTATCFMITGEVSTIFSSGGKVRKIHHLLLIPNLETAEQINDKLSVHGTLTSDGRPTLNMPASELVEEIMEISDDNAVIPAHIWTPWYSLFGSINGFEKIEDCYEDATKHIFALETGLSSDPPMNWRLSSLDRFTLISNSDSHSPYPYRLGREANVFEVEKLSYDSILNALRTKDPNHFKFTIETNPAYGKYHWTGHRNCGVTLPPNESKKLGGRCPVCRRLMTKGVCERVDDLADRAVGFRPDGVIGYVHLLPLQEAIGAVTNVNSLSSPSIWRIHNSLVTAFSNEYSILLDVPLQSLEKIVESKIAETIVKVRNNQVKVIPGYDGVYGKIQLFEDGNNDKRQVEVKKERQSSLRRFM